MFGYFFGDFSSDNPLAIPEEKMAGEAPVSSTPKMPVSQPKPKWTIYQGPRNKLTATRHLEYIVGMLLEDQDLKRVTLPKSTDKTLTLQIDTLSFSLKNILDALPDFEQFDFTSQQLDSFLDYFKPEKNFPRFENLHPELHPAERLAITAWTTRFYHKIQHLLRFGKVKKMYDLPLILMITCIAAQGLSKIEAPARTKLKRREGVDCKEVYTAERNMHFTAKTLVINRGFTAATFDDDHFNGMTFHQKKSINPIGKDIHTLSDFELENETLFPPFTEFKYIPQETTWLAYPMRSINRDQEARYVHSFSPEELHMITLNAAKPKLREIHAQLKEVLKDNHNKPYPNQNRLFAKRPRKMSVLTEIAQQLSGLIDSFKPTQAAIEQLIEMIENNTRTGRATRKLSSNSQWPSCTLDLLFFLKDLGSHCGSHAPGIARDGR